jgi:hypothetical protein
MSCECSSWRHHARLVGSCKRVQPFFSSGANLKTHLALILLASIAGVSSLDAQVSPKFGAEVGALYATVNGDDFEGTNAGVGFDVQLRAAFSAFSIGAGFLRTSHDIDEASDNIIISGFFAEPRYSFPTTSSTSLFLTGKLGRVKQSLETDIPDYGSGEFESSGFLFGGGGGVEFAMSPAVRLNVSALFSQVSFDDVEFEGETIDGTDSSGSSVMLRAGISFLFGTRR